MQAYGISIALEIDTSNNTPGDCDKQAQCFTVFSKTTHATNGSYQKITSMAKKRPGFYLFQIG
jgi:hypothetical protein